MPRQNYDVHLPNGLSKITQNFPSVSFDISKWNIPKNVSLADEAFNLQGNIDMLLGNDVFFRILLMKQIRTAGMPVLQKTRLLLIRLVIPILKTWMSFVRAKI